MKIWDFLCSFFSGAGTIAGAVQAGAELGSKVADGVHDKNERVAGADHVTAESNVESAKVNEDVAKAAVDTTDDAALDLLRQGRG